MHACPGCGSLIHESKFLCMMCASATTDVLIEEIGAALDDGDQGRADQALAEAVAAISEV